MRDNDPHRLLAAVDEATQRLLGTAAALTDRQVAGPSALPNWTRGHVLAHVARNADSLVNLLNWARTGVPTPQYPSRAARAAGIEAGAPRSAPAQVADVRLSAKRFATVAATLTPENWARILDLPAGPAPAASIAWRRLREVEVHHVDLDAGYRPDDWPAWFAEALLEEIAADLSARDDTAPLRLRVTDLGRDIDIDPCPAAPGGHRGGGSRTPTAGGERPVVSGPAAALAAWLAGRTGGARLRADGQLPAVPAWI